jgi:hypothetical protein
MNPVFDLNQLSRQYADYYSVLGSLHFIQAFFNEYTRALLAYRKCVGSLACEIGMRGVI